MQAGAAGGGTTGSVDFTLRQDRQVVFDQVQLP